MVGLTSKYAKKAQRSKSFFSQNLFLNSTIKKFKLINVFLIAFVFSSNAQDPLFTNTQQSLLYLNPSFAGSNGFIRNQFIYRNQWPSLSGSFVTYLNSFDVYIKSIRGGLGLSLSDDDQAKGTLKTSRFDLTYAQHLSLLQGKLKIIPSIQATYLQKFLDKAKLSSGDMIDARRGFVWNTNETVPSQSKKNIDVSSGLLINYKNFYFGSSVFHINQPDEGLLGHSKLPVRLSMFASGYVLVSENRLLNILGRYEKQQKFNYVQVAINTLLEKYLIMGCGYKGGYNTSFQSNSVYFNLGFRHHYLSLNGSYEIYINGLSTYAYELTASFNLRNKEQRKLLTDFEKW